MRLIDADVFVKNVVKSGFGAEFINRVTGLLIDVPIIEPKQGEWISLHNGKWKCSECGIEVLIYAKGNFCPNCGADVRKGADNEHDK